VLKHEVFFCRNRRHVMPYFISYTYLGILVCLNLPREAILEALSAMYAVVFDNRPKLSVYLSRLSLHTSEKRVPLDSTGTGLA